VQHVDLGIEMSREKHGEVQGSAGRIGKIDWHENSMEGRHDVT
jgi:hypothetical protein